MNKVRARHEIEEAVPGSDGSLDSSLTKSAVLLLESVDAYLAEHPDFSGWGRIPARGESTKPPVRMQA